jgi:predicted ester cyclase
MFAAINTQNLALLNALMAPDFVLHIHGQEAQGWEVGRRVIEEELQSFPDLHVAVKDIIAEGDKLCVRLRVTATHRGEYCGLAPTGSQLAYTVVAIWRLSEGKISEGWIVYDQMDSLKQLGVIAWKGFPDEGT